MEVDSYQNINLNKNISFLYLNRLLIQLGWGIVGVFGVIFFFEVFGNSLEKVLVLYVALNLSYFIFTNLGARLIGPIGMKKMMIISIPFFVLSMVVRIFWDFNILLTIPLFIAAVTLYKIFYWIPYHVEYTAFTNKKTRGRVTAFLLNITQIVLAITPLIGGFILSRLGYTSLFIISAIVVFLSILPLFKIKETHEKYSFGFLETFRELFSKKHRGILIANAANGAQSGVGTVVWPIFIFVILEGNYLSVGVITAITVLALVLLRFIIGVWIDKWGRKTVLRWGTFVYTTGWIVKIFVETGLGVFLADTYHNFGRVVNKTSFDVTVYDQAADNGHYVDEYTVLKETALLGGKGLMLLISLFLVSFLGITSTFLVAAGASLLMTIISSQKVDLEEEPHLLHRNS